MAIVLWMLHFIHCVCCKFDTVSLIFTREHLNWSVKYLLCPPPHLPKLRTFFRPAQDDLLALLQKLRDTGLKSEPSAGSRDIRFLVASFCMWSGCVGVFRSPAVGSLPVTVLWTNSSWGVSTAKDRWLVGAEKPKPLSLALSLFVFAVLAPLPPLPLFDFPRHWASSIRKKTMPSSFQQFCSVCVTHSQTCTATS